MIRILSNMGGLGKIVQMALVLMMVAGSLAALASLLMRRSIDGGGSVRAYLVVQMLLSCGVGIVLNPVRHHQYGITLASLALGFLGGLILGGMMWSLGRALERGPPALTFAILNCATVMPALVMAAGFGERFGHGYSSWHLVGSIIVVGGLTWAGWEARAPRQKVRWGAYIVLAFVLHVLLLTLLQWRALLLDPSLPASRLLPFRMNAVEGEWFMPLMLATAALMQFAGHLRLPSRREVRYGLLGGLVSGCSTFLLVLAPERAAPWENATLFPLFAVSVIIVCNIWGQSLYRERVNWRAALLCVAGLVLGIF